MISHIWVQSLKMYLDRKILALFVLGFSSGLPLLLVFSTLSLRMRQDGVSLTDIGWFSLVGMAYGFKFLWAPVVDHMSLGGLTRRLGRRRGWLLFSQVCVIIAMLGVGTTDPAESLVVMATWAVALAFASATQDIVADAFRIEILDEDSQGGGVAVFVNGYRIGMLVAGAGALVVADFHGWFPAYAVMAVLMLPGMGVALALAEPPRPKTQADESPALGARFERAIIAPFRDFTTRRHWLVIMLFIIVYKYGDALLGKMSNPFYVDMGFSGTEIAIVTKGWGFAMTLLGAFLGGAMSYRLGVLKALMVAGVFQVAGNLAFAALAASGNSLPMLSFAIAVENFTGAMATAAFVAYLSGLCSLQFTATQYALLTSLTAQARTIFAAGGGWLVDQVGWVMFFLVTVGAAAPGLLLLFWLIRQKDTERHEH